MNRDNQYYEISDAFLELRNVDDSEVEGMLRAERRAKDAYIHEGKAYSISGSRDMEAARKFIDEDANTDEIEVIDVDADSVEHIKKNSEYVGQAILSCNRCRANRFIDMDLLVASESDADIFNVEDECPHCHDAGNGYSLIGQVGKVQNDEPEADEASTEETDAASTEEQEAEISNDEKDSEEAAFDNDLESEEEASEESEEVSDEADLGSEEDVDIETFEEDEEPDGMETDTSEDELDDLDLPALGDEVDYDETEEDEDNVKESLNEDVKLNALAEEAWMMNQVISSMNNEDAYFGSWLYIWPDEETREQCAYDFGDRESFEELEEAFLKTYEYYHEDGLYNAAPEVVEYAHTVDKKLGLAKIENLSPVKPFMREALDCTVAGDIFKSITSPENIDKIIILDLADDSDEPRTIYKGSKEDLPMNVMGSTCKSFDVADGYLSCNIDSDVENTNRSLSKALECFSDDKTDKVLVWDQATGDEVFAGTKADACKQFGNCEFISFETPAVIRITVNNPALLAEDELYDNDACETNVEKLIKDIIKANKMSEYKVDKVMTNEYWISSCLTEMDDVELIYESFVKPTGNNALIKEFKKVTGYNNALEEAYEAGVAAGMKALKREEIKSRSEAKRINEGIFDRFKKKDTKKDNNNGVLYFKDYEEYYTLTNKKARDIDVGDYVATSGNAQLGNLKLEQVNNVEIIPGNKVWISCAQSEFDKDMDATVSVLSIDDGPKPGVKEAYMDRNTIISELKKLGKGYYKFDKYTDAQLFRMLEKDRAAAERKKQELADIDIESDELIPDAAKHTCEQCGADLNEAGTCPVCDDGEEDYTESVKSFKTRKELAEAITECKNNNKAYTIRRSTTEGFRYDLLVESASDNAALIKSKWASDEDDYGQIDDESIYETISKYFDANEIECWYWKKDDTGNRPAYLVIETEAHGVQHFEEHSGHLHELAEALSETNDSDGVTSLVPLEAGDIEVVDDIPQQMPVEYSVPQRQLMDKIYNVSVDIADAISKHYGFEATPELIVADIIRDLQLISGDVSVDELSDSAVDLATKELFKSYTTFYNFIDSFISDITGERFVTTPQQKIKQAIQALNGPAFSSQNIDRMIGSTAFLNAARSGDVPYITAADLPRLEEVSDDLNESLDQETCKDCGKEVCECDNVEVDTDKFDAELNEYFNSSYEDTVLYTTTGGEIEPDGTIVLEGLIQSDASIKPIKFTLNPETKISESFGVDKVLGEKFTVTNDLSEEVFEFKFDK